MRGGVSALQMTSTEEDLLSLDHYVRKTFHKTASLMANSCKAIAILGGQNREVAQLAWEYGRHVGLAFQVSRCTSVSPHVPPSKNCADQSQYSSRRPCTCGMVLSLCQCCYLNLSSPDAGISWRGVCDLGLSCAVCG